MVPQAKAASLTEVIRRTFMSMPETVFAACAAYSMQLTSPTTSGRQRS